MSVVSLVESLHFIKVPSSELPNRRILLTLGTSVSDSALKFEVQTPDQRDPLESGICLFRYGWTADGQ